MACGTLKPRYWPGLVEERPAEGEGGGGDAVVEDGASLAPPLAVTALTPFIAPLDGGVGDIDVGDMAGVAAPPTGDTLAPAGSRADDAAAPNPADGGGGGADPPPAA